jgi:cellulose synthase/poly-beta-1,6-N-acetylglucosamine synthase-like glycosyltransferase
MCDKDDPQLLKCSIGIMGYNEEANIGLLLEAILTQRTAAVVLTEIIVIASGCTDRTEEIVKRFAKQDPRIRLLVQVRREGKASAVNYFLSEAKEKILLVSSADILPSPDAIEQLVVPFADPEVAMTTCRPVPVNDKGRFMGFAAHMLWDLHHQVNLIDFKAGELIAFRKVFERIPYRTAVDEASIESVIRGQGYSALYVGTAATYNKGPDTVKDFLRQRRRIYAGHLALRDGVGYRVGTLSNLRMLALVLQHLDWRPRAFFWTWAVAALEVYGRLLGKRDYMQRRDHSIWDIANTTKQFDHASRQARVAGDR